MDAASLFLSLFCLLRVQPVPAFFKLFRWNKVLIPYPLSLTNKHAHIVAQDEPHKKARLLSASAIALQRALYTN